MADHAHTTPETDTASVTSVTTYHLTLDEISACPVAEMGHHIAALSRETNRLSEDMTDEDGSAYEAVTNLLYDADGQLILRRPESVADAAVLLLAVSASFRTALHDASYREDMIKAWIALGRVVKFLSGSAGIVPADVGAGYWTHSVDGLDDRLGAEWWIQRFLTSGGTIILTEKKGIEVSVPITDDEKGDEFRILLEERQTLNAALIGESVGLLAWQGMGCQGNPRTALAGRRWAIAWKQCYGDTRWTTTTQIEATKP